MIDNKQYFQDIQLDEMNLYPIRSDLILLDSFLSYVKNEISQVEFMILTR